MDETTGYNVYGVDIYTYIIPPKNKTMLDDCINAINARSLARAAKTREILISGIGDDFIHESKLDDRFEKFYQLGAFYKIMSNEEKLRYYSLPDNESNNFFYEPVEVKDWSAFIKMSLEFVPNLDSSKIETYMALNETFNGDGLDF